MCYQYIDRLLIFKDDIRSHLVKSFPQDVCDLVIAEVNYFQRLVIIPNAEKIPIQTRQDVAIEKQD